MTSVQRLITETPPHRLGEGTAFPQPFNLSGKIIFCNQFTNQTTGAIVHEHCAKLALAIRLATDEYVIIGVCIHDGTET